MVRIFLLIATVSLISACTAVPLVTKQKMTLGEVDIEGMECRREKPITSNMPKTVCASPEAWKAFDEAAAYENERGFDQVRSMGTGRFSDFRR
jgi:hypothetical protein